MATALLDWIMSTDPDATQPLPRVEPNWPAGHARPGSDWWARLRRPSRHLAARDA